MAKRPVFIPSSTNGPLVDDFIVEFNWNPGFAVSQKQKNIKALHSEAKINGINDVLEISTKSSNDFGKKLSAFNLCLKFQNGIKLTVEQAFQGSKVFERGGPYTEFYEMSGRKIKKDPRLKNSGKLTGFNLMGMKWDLKPRTAFYDWLYIHALDQNPQLSSELIKYGGFSDIEFNPKKSINCQARSAALYVSLYKNDMLVKALSGKRIYLEMIKFNDIHQIQSQMDSFNNPDFHVDEVGFQYNLFDK